MKKIILLILAVSMAGLAVAQQAQLAVVVTPTRGDIVEKARSTSAKYTVVYFAKQAPNDTKDSTRYYVVIRPLKEENTGIDYHTFKLFSGTIKTVSEIKNASFAPQDDGVIITTSLGTILFPRFGDGELILKSDTSKKITLDRLPRE